jgi:hypothetical protein
LLKISGPRVSSSGGGSLGFQIGFLIGFYHHPTFLRAIGAQSSRRRITS